MHLNLKLLFIVFNLFILSSCVEGESDDIDEDDTTQNEVTEDKSIPSLFSGSLIFSGNGSSTGTLNVIDDTCEFTLNSNTRNLSLTLEIEEGVITSGQYVLNIATEITATIVNTNNCNPRTFNETYTGNLTASNNNISFSKSIGSSVDIDGVNYSFNAEFNLETQSLSNVTITHSRTNLEQDITYSIAYNSPTDLDEVLVFTGNASGDGLLTPVDNQCEFNFRSNTNHISLILEIEDNQLVGGTYAFTVETEITGTVVNNLNCNPTTFNETWDGSLNIENGSINFSQNIGLSANLEGIQYNFEATYTNGSITSNTITHSSGALESDITYSVSF